MSVPTKKSGYAFKRQREEKTEKERAVLDKTPKIHTFFKTQTANVNAESTVGTVESFHSTATSVEKNTEADPEPQYDLDICSPEAEAEKVEQNISSSLMTIDDENSSEIGLNKIDFVDDPACWNVKDATTLECVIKRGIKQDINKLDFSRSKRLIDKQNRYASVSLFKTQLVNGQEVVRSYLMYSESTGKLFCVPCLLFNNGVNVTKLAKEGFDDWKHGHESLKKHENSSEHKSCVLTMKSRCSESGKISQLLSIQIEDEKQYWRKVLTRVVAVVRSLASAGLPFRGVGGGEKFNSSSDQGNFIMCIELISEFDPFLAEHIAKYGNPGQGHTSYLSSTTYEQFIKLMAEKVTKEIIAEVNAAKYFSIIVDSSPDISHVDQLSFVIRYVSENGDPVERFICFLPSVGHKSKELFDAVISTLAKYDIDIKNCRGQAYDNAANMSGEYTGLQSRIREINPTAVYTPCSAHSLNLVGEHAAGCCKESNDFFSLIQNLYVFFSGSTHRWEILQECLQKKDNVNLKNLSKTRWSAREDACDSLNRDWDEVLNALSVISNDKTEKPATRTEATGYLCQLNRFETAFLSILWGDLLSRFNVSSKKLQSTDIDLSVIVKIYDTLLVYVSSLRNDKEFDIYENGALVKSKVTEYKDSVKRKKFRKILPRDSKDNETLLEGRDIFKVKTYFVIIDRLIAELTRRMEVYSELNMKFGFFTEGDKMTRKSLEESVARLCNMYKEDLPTEEEFLNECLHFFSFIKTIDDNESPPKNILGLCKAIFENDLIDVYPYVNIALRIFLTMPASNCSAERSFSVLRRIKSYLRATMSHERLSDCAVLSIEKSFTKKVNYDEIIDAFANMKSRKKSL